MATKRKSIIEEALLEAKSLEDALKANTKEMLSAHMKKEIENIVESSLKEDEEEVEELIDVEGSDEEEDVPALEAGDDSEEEIDADADIDLDELELDLDLDTLTGGGDVDIEVADLPMDLDMGDDELDLTGASDDEVIAVFKKMSDEDEVEVVKDEDGIHLTDNETGAEYYIKESEELDEELCEGCDEEIVYEIELDESDPGGAPNKGAKDFDEEGHRYKKGPFDQKLKRETRGDDKYYDEGGHRFTKGPDGEKEYGYKANKGYTNESDPGGAPNKGAKDFDEEGHRYKKGPFDQEEVRETRGDDKYYDEDGKRYTIGPDGEKQYGYKANKGYTNEEDVVDLDVDEEITEDKTQNNKQSGPYGGGRQRYGGAKAGTSYANESKKSRKTLTPRKPKNVERVSESKLMKEYKELKSKNEEYKGALKVFKNKLNEVALFNTNLAYVNRLFTEHSTTKTEKMEILKRFDNAESIKESKSIYKTVKGELETKKPITESVENRVNKTVKSSKSELNESTTYVDPQIAAIKDLMRKIS